MQFCIVFVWIIKFENPNIPPSTKSAEHNIFHKRGLGLMSREGHVNLLWDKFPPLLFQEKTWPLPFKLRGNDRYGYGRQELRFNTSNLLHV